MRNFTPTFNDDKDKLTVLIMMLASIFLSFLPALIVVFCRKEKISESSYNISKAFFNFELFIFLLCLVFMVPIIGAIIKFFALPIIIIVNIVIVVINICAMASNKDIKVPVIYEFI